MVLNVFFFSIILPQGYGGRNELGRYPMAINRVDEINRYLSGYSS